MDYLRQNVFGRWLRLYDPVNHCIFRKRASGYQSRHAMQRYRDGEISLRDVERTIRGQVLNWMDLIATGEEMNRELRFLHLLRWSLRNGQEEDGIPGLTKQCADAILVASGMVPLSAVPQDAILPHPSTTSVATEDNWS
jgi:hypothetical protein